MKKTGYNLILLVLLCSLTAWSQNELLLHSGWKAKNAVEVVEDGTQLTSDNYILTGWLDAIVPGTVMTTLLHNKMIPDPFYGMNNEQIPDIFNTGPDHYTYWFYNEFAMPSESAGKEIWLRFRGINYRAEIFLNGRRVNFDTHEGMFLREKYLITHLLKKKGINRLAVLVEPPSPAGNPNGGQGGDGLIGRSVAMQCTAGWDWICAVRDRNTGIWDKVSLEMTGPVDIRDPFVKTIVPGKRFPNQLQEPVKIAVTAELFNSTEFMLKGKFKIVFDNREWEKDVILEPNSEMSVKITDIILKNPKLWWPNGIGDHPLYHMSVSFISDKGIVSDKEDIEFGVRETGSYYDNSLGARIFLINGQKIFIKGGNWICSDAMLRLSKERYETEVRMHAEMNMNMIRIWGGALTERPEFYEACDKYGILVWQDLWISGDCNGRWPDPRKMDSQARRREYPDNHSLFIRSVADQVKMLRNHPSLYLWCGGNEFPPPPDINYLLENEIFPEFDDTRLYLEESTSTKLAKNETRGTADGPYGIQNPAKLFSARSFGFNPEIGSVGMPNFETLKKMMDPKDMFPPEGNRVNPVWQYHKYLGYNDFIENYGIVSGIEDFCRKAQLVNYEQYRALQEGFNAHMWDWYSGMLVWKNQNPWTALRGQFYDYFLDQTGGFYGYLHGAKPVHLQLNLNDSAICTVNSTFLDYKGLTAELHFYSLHGKEYKTIKYEVNVLSNTLFIPGKADLSYSPDDVYFLRMVLKDGNGETMDENLYWLAQKGKSYDKLNELREIEVNTKLINNEPDRKIIEIINPSDETAFFVRLKLMNKDSGAIITPVFFEDNYITLFPGEKRTVSIETSLLSGELKTGFLIETDGWNVKKTQLRIN